jgi:cell division protein FtsZ
MMEMGKAMMGTGEADGPKRALDAAEAAISNPLLDDVSMKGAKGVLIHITGGPDLTLFEADEAANRIRQEVDPDANIKVGSTFDAKLEGRIRVSVVATGIDAEQRVQPKPTAQMPMVNTIGRGMQPARQPAMAIAAAPIAAAPAQAAMTLAEPATAAVATQPNPVHAMQSAAEEKLQADLAEQKRKYEEARSKFEEAEAAISRQRQAPAATRSVVRFDDDQITRESAGLRGEAAPLNRPAPPPEAHATGLMGTIGGLFTRKQAKRAEAAPGTHFQPEPDATVASRQIEPRFADAIGPRATHRPLKQETPSLFANGPAEDPLEIPAFLRRQANS